MYIFIVFKNTFLKPIFIVIGDSLLWTMIIIFHGSLPSRKIEKFLCGSLSLNVFIKPLNSLFTFILIYILNSLWLSILIEIPNSLILSESILIEGSLLFLTLIFAINSF